MSINQALVSGFMGRDPEQKTSAATDTEMCFFTVATNYSTKNASGEWETMTEWHSIVCFGRLANLAVQNLKKGCRVTVLGRMHTKKWTGKDGVERQKTEIIAEKLEFSGSSSTDEGNSQRPAQVAQQAAPAAFDDSDVPF